MDPDPEPDPDPLVRGTDPGIRIRICTKMSRITDTVLNVVFFRAGFEGLVDPESDQPEDFS